MIFFFYKESNSKRKKWEGDGGRLVGARVSECFLLKIQILFFFFLERGGGGVVGWSKCVFFTMHPNLK